MQKTLGRMFTVDTNLLAFTTPRRFLMGLAVWLKEPVILPPTVIFEVKRRLLDRAVDTYIVELPTVKDRFRQEQDEQFKGILTGAIDGFVEKDLPSAKGVFVRKDVNIREEGFVRTSIPNNIFVGRVPISENRDKRIAVETIASNVHRMVTSNMGSIHHVRFNQWGKNQYGLNEDFIYEPDAFMEHMLGHHFEDVVHQVAINMTLSNKERSMEENRFSLDNFVQKLAKSMPLCSNVIDEQERHISNRHSRWEYGRKLIQEDLWITARSVEDKRVARLRTARKAISEL